MEWTKTWIQTLAELQVNWQTKRLINMSTYEHNDRESKITKTYFSIDRLANIKTNRYKDRKITYWILIYSHKD